MSSQKAMEPMTPEKVDTMKRCYVMVEPLTPKTPKVDTNFRDELRKVINERNMLTNKTRRRFTDALDVIGQEVEISARKVKREKVLTEIVESESAYVGQLEIIDRFFMKPTKEKELLKQHDYDTLFGNISTIYKINCELLEELKKGSSNVVKAFSKLAPYFKAYSVYALEFRKSLEIVQTCSRHNGKFAKFLEAQESRPEVHSKLSALLIAPIQRVPRYKLLLKSLFNLTSPVDDDYKSLSDSLNKVEAAAVHINKWVADSENTQRLLEVQRCLQDGEPNIITPGRRLIKEGTLMKISAKSSHSTKVYVVLMSDIIIFCKMKKEDLRVNSLKCTEIFPLNKCTVIEILDKGSFRIMCQNEEVVLYHLNFRETTEWIEDIKEVVQTYIENRKTLRKDSSARRPVKRKDVNEYNEVGLSPGKPLRKKRRSSNEEQVHSSPLVTKRKPLRAISQPKTVSFGTAETISSPVFVTLKPPPTIDEMEAHSHLGIERIEAPPPDVFIFGKDNNPDRGFSFKMGRWFSGIGTSVRKLLGFKQNQ